MDLDLILERIRDAAQELAYENMMNDGYADQDDDETYDQHYDDALRSIMTELNRTFPV
jgi:hypothetical protein